MDWLPNGDFTESILNTSFDRNGKKEPFVLATENDSLNGMSMLITKLLNQTASIFADVRTYWSPEAVERVRHGERRERGLPRLRELRRAVCLMQAQASRTSKDRKAPV